MEFLIGADPEVFVLKDNKLVPAWGLIPGTKAEPYPVDGGAVQVDGMALEFNINPAKTSTEFVHNIHHVLSQLKAMIPGYEITQTITGSFDMKGLPKEATEIGCDPDYNAYDEGAQNIPPPDVGYRMVGGHVHIGWTNDADPFDFTHFTTCIQLAKQLDWALFIPSLLFDNNSSRRQSYGQPGNFRPKPYGIEYRTLSNFWIHSPKLTEMVFNQAMKAVTDLAENNVEYSVSNGNFMTHVSNIYAYGGTNYVIEYMRQYNKLYKDVLDLIDDKLINTTNKQKTAYKPRGVYATS